MVMLSALSSYHLHCIPLHIETYNIEFMIYGINLATDPSPQTKGLRMKMYNRTMLIIKLFMNVMNQLNCHHFLVSIFLGTGCLIFSYPVIYQQNVMNTLFRTYNNNRQPEEN